TDRQVIGLEGTARRPFPTRQENAGPPTRSSCSARRGTAMTEAEWQAGNDAEPMFAFLAGRGDARRWRLFTCACLREVGHLLADGKAREAFAVVPRWADGRAPSDDVASGRAKAILSRRYLLSSRFPRAGVGRRVFARMQGVCQALLHATLPASNPEAQAVAV